jgi:S-adenosyl methyltransferase
MNTGIGSGPDADAQAPRPSSWLREVAPGWNPPQIDPTMPHPIRMYDYMIGGKDNFQADREAVRYLAGIWPDVQLIARAAEAYARRSAAWIAQGHGLTQFLQMGTAIPIMNNSDSVVRQHVPDARYIYVTDDPITAAHARALLAGPAGGRVQVLLGEFRDPEPILDGPWLRDRLDFDQPIGVLLLGMLDYTADDERLRRALEQIVGALAPGSLVVVLQYLDLVSPEVEQAVHTALEGNPAQFTTRSMKRLTALLDGFEFAEPGLVRVTAWHPDGLGPGEQPGDDLAERCRLAGGVIVRR